MVSNAPEPGGAPGMAGDHIRGEAVGEDPPSTPHSVAAEAPRSDQELDRAACQRQIRHTPAIVAMHTPGDGAARRACAPSMTGMDSDCHLLWISVNLIHDQAGRDKS